MSSYDDLANDAIAGIDLLAARPDMDAKRIGLHGRSEGGIVARLSRPCMLLPRSHSWLRKTRWRAWCGIKIFIA
jgi:hypothetical protein